MQEAIWEDLPQVLWRTGYSSLGLMKLLLITGPPVLNLCVVSLVDDEWSLCPRPDWHLMLLFFSLSLPVVRQGHLVWYSRVFDINVFSEYVWTFISSEGFIVLRTKQPCRIIEHQSKVGSIQRVVLPNTLFSPSISGSHAHTSTLSQSLPTGVKLPCEAAWMGTEITEGCLCSWFPFHFEVSPDSQEQGPQSPTRVRALALSARTMISAGWGQVGGDYTDRQG